MQILWKVGVSSMKKLFAFFLALVLACSLAVPVLAVDITISGSGIGYAAYRIFDLSQGLKPGHSDDGDCSVENCDKVSDPGSHWNYAYSLNPKYIQVLSAVFADLGMDDIEESGMIAAIQEFDGDATRIFADGLYKRVRDLAPEYASDSNTFAGVDPGYYLIAETGTAGPGDSTSLVMLDTAGLENVTVTAKEDVPTLTKKIMVPDRTSNPGDVAYRRVDGAGVDVRQMTVTDEYVFGEMDDYIWYELTAELPDQDVLDAYEDYTIMFHDDISEGLKINIMTIGGQEFIPGEYYDATLGVSSFPSGCLIGYDDGAWPGGCSIAVRTDDDDVLSDGKCELEIEFSSKAPSVVEAFFSSKAMRKDAGRGASAGMVKYEGPHKIVIWYGCKPTDEAVTGAAGNPNTAYLTFSNNPYDAASTGKTPEDKVSVFMPGLRVNKTDGTKPLPGAEFSLFYYQEGSGWESMGPLVSVKGFDGTSFEALRLFSGKFKLVETKAPDGYQKADDMVFNIVMEAEEVSDDPKLTKLDVLDEDGNSMTQGENAVFSADLSTGMITMNVVNYAGVKLPSTGGAGVYGIYVAGVVMALAGTGAVMVYGVNRKKKEAG